MMKKSIKILSIALTAVVCFTMAIVMMAGNLFTAKAATNEKFTLSEGFAIRTVSPDGLRVVANVSDESVKSEGVQFGTLMIPEELLGEAELTVDTNDVLNIVTKKWNDDGKTYNSVLIPGGENQTFSDALINTPIVARGYYQKADGSYVYTANTVTKSIAYVAAYAKACGEEGGLIDMDANKINTSITVNNGADLVIGETYDAIFTVGNIKAVTTEKVTVNYTSSAPEVATVDATTGKITPIKAGTTEITAKLSGNEDVTATVTVTVGKILVEGTQNYVFGFKQTDLALNADAYDGDIVKVTMNDMEIATSATVAASSFTKYGDYEIKVETANSIYTEKVRAVNAIIDSVEEFQGLGTYAYTGTKYSVGAFILADNINFDGVTVANATAWEDLQFDGQGYVLSNVVSENMFGAFFKGGTIKNVAIVDMRVSASTKGGMVLSVDGGAIENVYVSGYETADTVAKGGLIAHNYAEGAIKNVLVQYDTVRGANSGSFSMIANINTYDAVVENNSSYTSTAQLDAEVPTGIENAYSIGKATQHITANTHENYTWNTYSNLTKATGNYATGADFLAAIKGGQNIFTDGSTSFSLDTDENSNTVLKFGDNVVKVFADGILNYDEPIGHNTDNLVINVADFDGISSIAINNDGMKVVADIDSDESTFTIAGSNFSKAGVYSLAITNAAGDTVYRNVKVITAIITTAEQLAKMEEWGRPANFDASKLGTSGYLYVYTGEFMLGNNIDFGGVDYVNEVHVGSGTIHGYTGGCGAYWKNMIFDGNGYTISNISIGHHRSLFGNMITDSKIYDVAFKNVKISGGLPALIGSITGTTSIENLFVDGYVAVDTTNGTTDTSFVVGNKTATTTIKNVLVNISSMETNGKVAGIIKTANDASILNTVKNAYTIGSINNIAYAHDKVNDNLYKWGYWTPVDGTAGGYTNARKFMADKDAIFTGDFAKAFSYKTNAYGNTDIYFLDNEQPIMSLVDGAPAYDLGYAQSTDLVLNKADFNNEAITSVQINGADLTVTDNSDGTYTVDMSAYAKVQDVMILVNNKYGRNVRIVTALIDSQDDFVKIGTTYGTTGTGYAGAGTFVQTADITFTTGTQQAITTAYTTDFYYDGQGYKIENAVGTTGDAAIGKGLFGASFLRGKIENVALINFSINWHYQAGIVGLLNGGVLENIYVQSVYTAGSTCSPVVSHYVAGTIKNVVVESNATSGNVAMIANVDAYDAVFDSGIKEGNYDPKTPCNVNGAIPAGIQNTYSISSLTKHLTADDHYEGSATDHTWNRWVALTQATKFAYADDTAFLADKDTIFTGDFASAFKLDVDSDGNTVLTLCGKVVKTYA